MSFLIDFVIDKNLGILSLFLLFVSCSHSSVDFTELTLLTFSNILFFALNQLFKECKSSQLFSEVDCIFTILWIRILRLRGIK